MIIIRPEEIWFHWDFIQRWPVNAGMKNSQGAEIIIIIIIIALMYLGCTNTKNDKIRWILRILTLKSFHEKI